MSDEERSPSDAQLSLNVGVELDEQSRLKLTIKMFTDVRTEAFRFSAESPGYRARNYLQWIPPRTIGITYSRSF